MNQMVSIREQEPVSMHAQLVASYKARQARYAAAALPPPPKTPTQVLADHLLVYAAQWREEEEKRHEEEIKRLVEICAEIERSGDDKDEEELRSLVWYPPIRRIIRMVSEAYGVTRMDIVSKRRTRGGGKSPDVITPRQIVMYLAKKTTTRSLPEIGRLMGGKDHTTVLHGVRKITAMMEADESFRAKVEELRAAVTGQVGG